MLGSLGLFYQDVTERRVLEKQVQMGQKMEAVGAFPEESPTTSTFFLGVILGYIQSHNEKPGPGEFFVRIRRGN